MPKLKKKLPSYRLHKVSGQAVVTLNGRDHYLGKYDTAESNAKYKRVIAEWLAEGQFATLKAAANHEARPDTRVDELVLAYLRFAQGYYRKHGKPTGEFTNIQHAIGPASEMYGHFPIIQFGATQLKAVREQMIDAGLSRKVINARVNRIRRIFKWGVENEFVPPHVLQALQAVAPLKYGRTRARETAPVRPVPDADVDAVLPLVTRPIRAMIEVQRLTGMRPGEVVQMRRCDLDMSGSTWIYRPASHKTEHHGLDRVVFIGPHGQNILRPFLVRDELAFLFCPRDAVRDARRRQQKNTKGAVGKSRGKMRPRKRPGDRYSTNSYCYAIHKACKTAGVPCWGPNRLRHNAATYLRKQFGIDAARTILGHKSLDVTEVYAELDHRRAADIMGEVG